MIKRFLFICTVMMLCMCGCEKNEFVNETEEHRTIGFVMNEIDVENSNLEYYSKFACLNNISYPKELNYKDAWEQYGNIGGALAWKLDQNIDNPNARFHVYLQYFGDNVDSDQKKIYIDKAINEINNEKGLNLDVDKWSFVEDNYYCILSREEIIAIGNREDFFVWYIGSGEGDYNKFNISTLEDVDRFVELYGDGYVQCIKGKEIQESWK